MDGTEVELLDAEFMSATGDVPETLGTPTPGAGVTESGEVKAAAFDLTTDQLAMLIAMPFNMASMAIGDGGEFWQLHEMESAALAQAWLPVAQKLLEMWGMSSSGGIITAALMTVATLAPRLAQEKKRRAAAMVVTETVKSGDSFSSVARPEAGNHSNPTDWLAGAAVV